MFEENGILVLNGVTKQCNLRGHMQCKGGGNLCALSLRGDVMVFTAQQGRDQVPDKNAAGDFKSAILVASGRSQKMRY